MRKQLLTYLLYCCVWLCCTTACTTVELCPETEHPHVATIQVNYDWHGEDQNKEGFPTEMNIVASRILNTWRAHGIADIASKTVRNGLSEPIITDKEDKEEGGVTEGEEEEGVTKGEENTDNEEGTETPPTPTPVIPFRLKGGEYKAFTINSDAKLTIDSLQCYLTHPAARVDTLYLHMEEVSRNDITELQGLKLPDFNPTYRYIKNVGRLFYGLNTNIEIHTGQTETLFFDMQPVSQEVEVKFSIKKTGDHKDQIKIETVVAEMSGLCGRINISEANLDTTNLYRMVFPGNGVSLSEEVNGDISTYTTRFYTLGIVPSAKKELLVGRGILQIAVKASVPKSLKNQQVSLLQEEGQEEGEGDKEEEKEDELKSLFFYAAANPRDILLDAQLLEKRENKRTYLRYRKDPILIELGGMMEINSEDIINATDEDTWHENGEGGNGDVDIEM